MTPACLEVTKRTYLPSNRTYDPGPSPLGKSNLWRVKFSDVTHDKPAVHDPPYRRTPFRKRWSGNHSERRPTSFGRIQTGRFQPGHHIEAGQQPAIPVGAGRL